MLRKLAPTRYQGPTGETVRIAAVPQDNGGVSFAAFRYGGQVLATQSVQGHPGCQFAVAGGAVMFGAVVTFAPGSPNARYHLFEEVNGTLVDLRFTIEALFGPAAQFQLDGVAAAVPAAASMTTAAPLATSKAAKAKKPKKAKKAAKKQAAKKKPARKKPAKRKPASKAPAARKGTARSKLRKATRTAPVSRASRRRPARRKPTRKKTTQRKATRRKAARKTARGRKK